MERVVVVVRPPPDVSLYHRKSNPLFPQVLNHLGHEQGVHAVVLPRTQAQREYVKALELPSVVVPERRDRRSEPGRAGGPGGLRRRHDEPRGGRARDTGLHDLRRSAGRRRRGPDQRALAASADRPPRIELQTTNAAQPTAARSGAPGRHDARRSPMSALTPGSAAARPRNAACGGRAVGPATSSSLAERYREMAHQAPRAPRRRHRAARPRPRHRRHAR